MSYKIDKLPQQPLDLLNPGCRMLHTGCCMLQVASCTLLTLTPPNKVGFTSQLRLVSFYGLFLRGVSVWVVGLTMSWVMAVQMEIVFPPWRGVRLHMWAIIVATTMAITAITTMTTVCGRRYFLRKRSSQSSLCRRDDLWQGERMFQLVNVHRLAGWIIYQKSISMCGIWLIYNFTHTVVHLFAQLSLRLIDICSNQSTKSISKHLSRKICWHQSQNVVWKIKLSQWGDKLR